MEILRASDMGFCFGVRRAVEMAEKAAAELGELASLGSVVHNQQVVQRLTELGVHVVRRPADARGRAVIVPSHGVAPAVVEEVKRLGLRVIDATCPMVTRSQQWARRLSQDGFTVIIFGNPDHPEVRGVLGWAQGKGMAFPDEQSLKALPLPSRIAVLSQTTQTEARFASFVGSLLDFHLKGVRELRVINTLCNATTSKQAATRELARTVDLMIVVGGRESANTRHLAEVASAEGVETHQVESPSQIDGAWLRGRDRVGVTAGASTPNEAVEAVVARLEELA
ncbi:MAG TPA: 4-hydroxy-3-methylbut-2-enyl diphosphate reductase [Dehalococcoidia bacterium]|nr:4-hydroxy-3-methylbut-2-enyl diphosphate reductase [Dehalococcoidia bacterium]